MLILLAIIELLQSLIQRIQLWLFAPLRPRYSHKYLYPTDRHDHRHSTKKPDWLKQEIIRLKAVDNYWGLLTGDRQLLGTEPN
jgi:hypothetical protein